MSLWILRWEAPRGAQGAGWCCWIVIECEATQLSLKGCGDWERHLKTARKQVSLLSSNKIRRTQGATGKSTLNSGKVKEQLILESLSKYMVGRNIIRSSQHGFNKGKSWQFDKLLYWVDWVPGLRWSSGVVHLDFSNAFDDVSHKIFIEKLMSDEHTVRLAEYSLNGQDQRYWSVLQNLVGGQ